MRAINHCHQKLARPFGHCSQFGRVAVAILLAVLQVSPLTAADPPKVNVTPGTPNVWSMEQAHYLLNRLRANKDGLQTGKPSSEDLNPNAINGLRLDALQSFLGVAASFDQIDGTQTKAALDAFHSATNRRNDLIALADVRRSQLQIQELQAIQLDEQLAVLKAKKDQAKDPAEVSALSAQIPIMEAKLTAARATVAALRGQVAALTDAASGGSGSGATATGATGATTTGATGATATGATGATATGATGATAPTIGSAPTLSGLASPSPDYAQPIKASLLATTFDTLLKSTATSFTQPRLHASQMLDNFVDMQYEIVAKQLTTLRDEVGKGQRVVFLELPTSISAGAHRKLPFVAGGEDHLAQSWWQLKKLYLGYDRENSPCWVNGEDVYDGLQTELGFKQGRDVDAVPKGLKALDRGVKSTDVPAKTPDEALVEAGKNALKTLRSERDALIAIAKGNSSGATPKPRSEQVQEDISNLGNVENADTVRTFIQGKLGKLGALILELRPLRDALTDAELKYEKFRRDREADESVVSKLKASLDEQDVSFQYWLGLHSGGRGARPQPKSGRPSAANQTAVQSQQPMELYKTSSSRANGNIAAAQLRLDVSFNSETTARRIFETNQKLVDKKQAEVRQLEAELLSYGVALNDDPNYYSAATRSKVAGLEQPCRQAQVDFSRKERNYHENLKHFKALEQDKLAGLKEKNAAGLANLDKLVEEINQVDKELKAEEGAIKEREEDSKRLQKKIDGLNAQNPVPADKISKIESEKKLIDEAVKTSEASLKAKKLVKSNLDTREQQMRNDQQRSEAQERDYDTRRQAIDDELHRLRKLEELKFRDELEYRQMRIYAEFGGPEGIHRAFELDIQPPRQDKGLSDSGMVRTLEIFPRQTALNVNSTHVLVNNTAVSLAMKYLFGLGGKVDYQRMREKYDQFVQQEVFASGFGKGSTEFGWTFGPNPGTRVLNPGTRTTYAALVVPSNATGLEILSTGCSFHHNDPGPPSFPPKDKNDRVACADHQTRVVIGLPDRDSSGSFWVTDVRYAPVKAGQRATVVLRGLFSPETNVLVNGKRLTQVMGLGKPTLAMDFGGAEDPGTGVIWGSYEYVNEHYMTLLLNVPAEFKDSKFPSITLISPSRTAAINSIPLAVNGNVGVRLDDETLLAPSQPSFEITKLLVVQVGDPADSPKRRVTAFLSGTRLSSLGRLWLNGQELSGKEAVSDNLVKVDFEDPDTLKWNITAVTGEEPAKARTSSALSIPNPIKLMITSVKPENVEYPKGEPVKATLVVSGSAFRPELLFNVEGEGVTLVTSAFVAPDEWIASVTMKSPDPKRPDPLITVSLVDGKATPVAGPPFHLPKKPADPSAEDTPKGKTTVTEIQSQKTVTEKQ